MPINKETAINAHKALNELGESIYQTCIANGYLGDPDRTVFVDTLEDRPLRDGQVIFGNTCCAPEGRFNQAWGRAVFVLGELTEFMYVEPRNDSSKNNREVSTFSIKPTAQADRYRVDLTKEWLSLGEEPERRPPGFAPLTPYLARTICSFVRYCIADECFVVSEAVDVPKAVDCRLEESDLATAIESAQVSISEVQVGRRGLLHIFNTLRRRRNHRSV